MIQILFWNTAIACNFCGGNEQKRLFFLIQNVRKTKFSWNIKTTTKQYSSRIEYNASGEIGRASRNKKPRTKEEKKKKMMMMKWPDVFSALGPHPVFSRSEHERTDRQTHPNRESSLSHAKHDLNDSFPVVGNLLRFSLWPVMFSVGKCSSTITQSYADPDGKCVWFSDGQIIFRFNSTSVLL